MSPFVLGMTYDQIYALAVQMLQAKGLPVWQMEAALAESNRLGAVPVSAFEVIGRFPAKRTMPTTAVPLDRYGTHSTP